MFGTLNKDQIEKVIHENLIGRLGCSDSERTYVVPLSYAYDGRDIYARSLDGLKISMMRKNPGVCFQIDTMKDMANWESVIVWGKFEELKNDEERNSGLQKLLKRHLPKVASNTVKLTSEWPFINDEYSKIDGIVFRINVTEKTGRCEMGDGKNYDR